MICDPSALPRPLEANTTPVTLPTFRSNHWWMRLLTMAVLIKELPTPINAPAAQKLYTVVVQEYRSRDPVRIKKPMLVRALALNLVLSLP